MTPIAVYGNQFSVSDPEWVTNDRTIVFGGAGHPVNFDDLDSGEDYNYAHWFDNPEDTGDGELSRNGRNLVTTYSYGENATINGTQKRTLTAGGAARQRFKGMLKVACKANAATTCKVVATVKVGKRRYTSKPATAKLAVGTATTLKLTFGTGATKAIKKALRRGKLTAKVTLSAGSATTIRVVTLKR